MLRAYFEPSDAEREQGLKTPTKAHRAIAQLVKAEYLRLILTTNFDRLLEAALDEVGVSATIISSEDQLKAADPYVHQRCVVVKLHGDYRDARIKNTPDELAKYSTAVNRFLDRALDEFGFIVCGWSGLYDEALKSAVLRSPSRRYSWYWLTRKKPEENSTDMITARRAEVVEISTSDDAFTRLHELVLSLEDVGQPHPLSVPLAVAEAKRFLSEPKYQINLHDLVTEETRLLLTDLASPSLAISGGSISTDEFQSRARRYEVVTERLRAILAAIAFYDKDNKHGDLLTTAITRSADRNYRDGLISLLDLQSYPALLLVYAAGIAALSARNFPTLAAILLKPKARTRRVEGMQPIIYVTNTWTVMNGELQKSIPRPGADREHTPLSNFLQDTLRSSLAHYVLGEAEWQLQFDLFEYIISLVYADTIERDWQPWGAYSWRWRDQSWEPGDAFFKDDLQSMLEAGFFGGSSDRFFEVVESHKKWLTESIRQW